MGLEGVLKEDAKVTTFLRLQVTPEGDKRKN